MEIVIPSWLSPLGLFWLAGIPVAAMLDGWRGCQSRNWTPYMVALWLYVPLVPFLFVGVVGNTLWTALRGGRV